MLCEANNNMPGWPQGERRDVDPEDELYRGWLRARYIVPLRPRPRPPETPNASNAPEVPSGAVTPPEPASGPQVTPARPRRAKPRVEDE
jgi:hypothetical protein